MPKESQTIEGVNHNETITSEQAVKDSGNRTEFETGAVRDISKGKGRCDLLPLDIIADRLDDKILRFIDEYMREGDPASLWFALDVFIGEDIQRWCGVLLEVSKHFEDGAKKYGERNWQKGIPAHSYIDSAVRHYLKYLRRDKDEPHDRAFVWNILCCIWTIKNRPEMQDMPTRQEKRPKKDAMQCRACLYYSMTKGAYDQLGLDPCLSCRDSPNWQPKED